MITSWMWSYLSQSSFILSKESAISSFVSPIPISIPIVYAILSFPAFSIVSRRILESYSTMALKTSDYLPERH